MELNKKKREQLILEPQLLNKVVLMKDVVESEIRKVQ